MPTQVIAKAGDCLCGIASDFGFFNCQPLRDLPANSRLLNGPLKDGDEVTVPDVVVEDHPRAVDTKHTFTLKTSPPVNIRYVHGSPDKPYRDDDTVSVLNISNYVTNKGGSTGSAAFPTGYGFNYDGHHDPDTFKVEVWDPAAGASVNVKLEALKPVYTAGPDGKLTATSWVEFTDANRRIDTLECKVVSATTDNTYRSKYMRLVVDEDDRTASGTAGQVLFVTDMADGLGTDAAGDNDTVEILDQMVRATYVVDRCTGSPKCQVSVVAPIGGDERRRIRLHFYVVRREAGVNELLPGTSTDTVKQHLRRRTFRWYRRVFAQANIAPRIVSMSVIDPPDEGMLCLSHDHGNTVLAAANLTFDVESESTIPVTVTVPLIAGETPLQVGAKVGAALPAGFTAEAFATPRSTSRLNSSCDVVIKANNGERVTITNELIPPAARMTVAVPRIVTTAVDSINSDGSNSFLTIDTKRVLRSIPVTDDAIHCAVIVGFTSGTLLGQAYQHNLSTDPPFQPDLPYRSATIMAYSNSSGGVLDGGETFPMVSQHESTHILTDMIHTKASSANAANQLMAQFAELNNPVTAPKRLCDGPFTVTLEQNLTHTMVHRQVKLVEQIRTFGAGKLEAW